MEFTRTQLRILLGSNRKIVKQAFPTNNPLNDGGWSDYAYGLRGSGEYRSAMAMEKRGMGLVHTICPHNCNFFRPRKGVVEAANEHEDARWARY